MAEVIDRLSPGMLSAFLAGVSAAGSGQVEVEMDFHGVVTLTAQLLEAAGIAVIIGGFLVVAIATGWTAMRSGDIRRWYQQLRQGVGRAILLGLEILVGADIIRTVAEQPTLRSVAVLAGIVAIRTFLSFTLEVELEGRWPWEKRRS